MIGKVDTSLGAARFEEEIAAFRAEVSAGPNWLWRERYVDRGKLDPFYILAFDKPGVDIGDDLRDERLFVIKHPHLSGVHQTRQPVTGNNAYWKAINSMGLLARLERFAAMYRENVLQPPGYRNDRPDVTTPHPKFRDKRFLFQIQSPRRRVIGVGPQKFAGAIATQGAIRGRVLDAAGNPQPGAGVVFATESGTLRRTTDANGLFWFSRVPPGRHRLSVADASCRLELLPAADFGAARGRLLRSGGEILIGHTIELEAPDGEVFNAAVGAGGQFSSGLLPAFPYTLRVPGFLFKTRIWLEGQGLLSGTLVGENNLPLAGKRVVLAVGQDNLSEAITDSAGAFHFGGLDDNRYTLRVPGYRLYARVVATDRVEGRGQLTGKLLDVDGRPLPDAALVMKQSDKEIARQRSDATGLFRFGGLAADRYTLAAPGYDLSGQAASAGKLEGHVSGARGTVRLYLLAQRQEIASTRTNTDGAFAFDGLVAETYRLGVDGYQLVAHPRKADD